MIEKGKHFYNNGIIEKLFFDTDDIPDGFIKGKIKKERTEAQILSHIRSSEKQREKWRNKSTEEKEAWRNKCSNAQLNRSKESWDKQKAAISDYYSSLSDDERKSMNERRAFSCKNSWNNKPKEEKDAITALRISHGAGWNHKKIKITNLEKYGVENQFLRQDLQQRYNHKDSESNIIFKHLLEENDIIINDETDREFPLENRSYDFKIGKNLIEIDPWPTHNSTWSPFGESDIQDIYYHKEKTELAKKYGYRCIHVFDWDDIYKIINLLKDRETIYARKCEIKEVDLGTAREYLNQYHLQGYAKDSIRMGLFYNNQLVSIMTFGKPRYNKKFEYELIRYCSNYNVIGGAEKLFKHFINNYNPKSIVSYCDNSKFNGDVYTKLGFVLKDDGKPSRHWYNGKTKRHITDNLLRQRGYDQLFGTNYGKGTSNEQLMLNNGFVEIYDSGQSRFELFL